MDTKQSTGDYYVTCPYNPAHRIIHHRLQTHLIKCRKNYKDEKRVQCVFNQTHNVPEPELQYHLASCKDRFLLDSHTIVSEDVNRDRDKYPIDHLRTVTSSEENWDNEDAPTYNPEEHMRNKPILQKLDVASKAKRKDFRMEARAKFQQLEDQTYGMQDSASALYTELRKPRQQTAAANVEKVTVEEEDPAHVTELLSRIAIKGQTGQDIDHDYNPEGNKVGNVEEEINVPRGAIPKRQAKEHFPALGGSSNENYQPKGAWGFGRGRGRGRNF